MGSYCFSATGARERRALNQCKYTKQSWKIERKGSQSPDENLLPYTNFPFDSSASSALCKIHNVFYIMRFT